MWVPLDFVPKKAAFQQLINADVESAVRADM
jgi:hypothetical protein